MNASSLFKRGKTTRKPSLFLTHDNRKRKRTELKPKLSPFTIATKEKVTPAPILPKTEMKEIEKSITNHTTKSTMTSTSTPIIIDKLQNTSSGQLKQAINSADASQIRRAKKTQVDEESKKKGSPLLIIGIVVVVVVAAIYFVKSRKKS